MPISFSKIDVRFIPTSRVVLKRWIKMVAERQGYRVGTIAYGFCSDAHIIEANRRYLQHDYFTDIITFDYSQHGQLDGDLLISIDTVRSNADALGIPFSDELHRVMIHGVLHLMGYNDSSDNEMIEMRAQEDGALNLLKAIFQEWNSAEGV